VKRFSEQVARKNKDLERNPKSVKRFSEQVARKNKDPERFSDLSLIEKRSKRDMVQTFCLVMKEPSSQGL
jgi:hypothetical protein